MSKKLVAFLLTVVLFSSAVINCYSEESPASDALTEVFIRQELFRQYSLIYDTFSAAITLDDGTEITGIGFSDYSAYYEDDDGTGGFFPAGFIADKGYRIPKGATEKGLVIENLDFTDETYQYVLDYETVPFMEHCVKDGQYLKYGVNEYGAITYETSVYEHGVCDEQLGALYSYDTNRYVFDPDMGNYVRINGTTLFEQIDFAAIEAKLNQLIENQNLNFSHQEVVSSVHLAHEAILSHLLSMQEEMFLGYRVSDLVESASQLDPMQCIRITPEGIVIIDIIDSTPQTADDLTKWLVGAGCLIAVAGSIALEIFVPAAQPLSGAIMGAAVDVFLQVVIESKSLASVQWGKVAVAAASGAVMAWACPMAAAGATTAAIRAGASEVLGKIAGYGVLTLSNSVVAGVTNYAIAKVDGKEAGWNTFLIGAAIGAAGSVLTSALSETMSAVGPKVSQILSRTKAGKWIGEGAKKASRYIQGHQIHIHDGKGNISQLEKILAPKSVHMAAKNAMEVRNAQTGDLGGKFSELTNPGDGTQNKHEIPSCDAYNKAKGLPPGKRGDLPAIKMSAADHAQTSSYGISKAAINYRAKQYQLISEGNMTAAIQMDIDNLHYLFDSKYDEGIRQALRYAIQEGWWNPWTENIGNLTLLLESVNLTLEEIMP